MRLDGSPRPRPRLFAVLGVLVVVASLALLAAQVLTGGDGNGSGSDAARGAAAASREKAAEREALLAYAADVEELGKEGGRVVQLGLKAGVQDIHERRYPDAQLEGMATAWKGDLERIGGRFAALSAPPFLSDAQFLYERALAGYVSVADTLLAAVRSDGKVRDDLVSAAAAQGREADKLYDRAGDVVDRHRRRLGLPVEQLPSERQDGETGTNSATNDVEEAGIQGPDGER